MQGCVKGVATYIKKEQPSVYMVGCACHLIHLAAERGSKQLHMGIEDNLIDIYYYLDKSSKRKSLLQEAQKLCNDDVRKILKHVSTRWLSLGICVNRLLEQWQSLTVYFEEEVRANKPKSSSGKALAKSSSSKDPAKSSRDTGLKRLNPTEQVIISNIFFFSKVTILQY